ncbi:hypothetical protein RJT34_24251 [Clitoria ternatea]|uniref:Response regulatory domain-containing protein n=1 Tax=Clitoria ternatea TaxID=43366 RepID=A0AAN9IJ31_CLITE
MLKQKTWDLGREIGLVMKQKEADGFGFVVDVDKSLPDNVIGDEKRVFQVILHMVGNVINGNHEEEYLYLEFLRKLEIKEGMNSDYELERSVPSEQVGGRKLAIDRAERELRISICKRIIQCVRNIVEFESLVCNLQGNIWLIPNAQGFPHVTALFLRFQLWSSIAISISELRENSKPSNSNSFFRGLQVLLADNDDVNRAVTQKLLQKLGFTVTSVSSKFECLNVIGPVGSSFQVILLDLHMPKIDGFEVSARIRKFRSRNWPIIVALTVSTEEDLLERCMHISINGVIRKPTLLQGIADELHRILGHRNNIM